MNDTLLKYSFEGLRFLTPIITKFLSEKHKEKRLKEIRIRQNRMSIILLPRKGGKSYICNYLENLECDNNTLYFDLDDSSLISNNFNYNNMIKSLNKDSELLLLMPLKLKIIKELRDNFDTKNIILFTSDIELSKYLHEKNECELNVYCMTFDLYSEIDKTIENSNDRTSLLKSFIKITKLKGVKNYNSYEELREMIKSLLV